MPVTISGIIFITLFVFCLVMGVLNAATIQVDKQITRKSLILAILLLPGTIVGVLIWVGIWVTEADNKVLKKW